MSTTTPTPNDLPPAPVTQTPPAPADEPETYPAEHVHELRQENAKYRAKAKSVDDANGRLLTAYAKADGRLVDAAALTVSEDLVGDDGLIDQAKVGDAIGALLADKPYLAARRPTAPLPMGARPDAPADASWVAALRGELR